MLAENCSKTNDIEVNGRLFDDNYAGISTDIGLDESPLGPQSKKINKVSREKAFQRILLENQRLKQVVESYKSGQMDLPLSFPAPKEKLRKAKDLIKSSGRCQVAAIRPGQCVNVTIETEILYGHEHLRTDQFKPFHQRNILSAFSLVAPAQQDSLPSKTPQNIIRSESDMRIMNLIKSARLLLRELGTKMSTIKELLELEGLREQGIEGEVLELLRKNYDIRTKLSEAVQ
eukprot:TRINITY_DN11997_c0_g1_i1.p1 TRINITY_DN11997_c0_g1~~TRINITY_DN11997_c0_g1_i1.p1  ORF type:complete len:231 (+),score=32.29 TRINITY_DN11997_c0_g1_i1:157-849(+)